MNIGIKSSTLTLAYEFEKSLSVILCACVIRVIRDCTGRAGAMNVTRVMLLSSLDASTALLTLSICFIALVAIIILIRRLKPRNPRGCLKIEIIDDRIQRIQQNGQNMIFLFFWIRYTNTCSDPTTINGWQITRRRGKKMNQEEDLKLQPLQSETIQYSQSVGVNQSRLRGTLTVTHSHGKTTIKLPDYKWRLDTDDNILYP